MRGIEVRERGQEGMLVEFAGEFDRHDLKDLRETLDDVLSLRLPVALDLSGVNFLGVEATREVTIYSYLCSHHLTLRNPSWQVRGERRGLRARILARLPLRGRRCDLPPGLVAAGF